MPLMVRDSCLLLSTVLSLNLTGLADPFDANEPNPTLTNAIDSSLWELYSQKSHYHAPAATLARIFEEPFTKPNYSLEDFLDHTYSTVSSLAVLVRVIANGYD